MRPRRVLFHFNRLRTQLGGQGLSNLPGELVQTMTFFHARGWECYFADWKDVDPDTMECSPVIRVSPRRLLYDTNIHAVADVVIARGIGSVELYRNPLRRYLERLHDTFSGVVLNDPQAMIYGMTKTYLFDLEKAGFPVIPSREMSSSCSYGELREEAFGSPEKTVIKPLTGEAGNSLELLSDVNEEWLRGKEEKVGGWLLQPLVEGVSDGELSLIFLNKKFCFSVEKTPTPEGDSWRLNNRFHPRYTQRAPTDEELGLATRIVEHWEFPLHTARIDLVNDRGEVRIMEVETVNPSFFYSAIDPADQLRFLEGLESLLHFLYHKRS